MEDDSRFGTGMSLDLEMKDRLETETEQSHVILRQQYATVSDEIVFPFNRNTDSLALLSVYRYAQRIKYFLGWKDCREDSEAEENYKEFFPQNLSNEGEAYSIESVGGGFSFPLQREINNHKDAYKENDKNNEAENGIQCYGNSVDNKRSSYYIDLEDFSKYSLKEKSDKNAFEENIENDLFRSEVSLIIEDCSRYKEVSPATDCNLLALSNWGSNHKAHTDMDNSLVHDDEIDDGGLILNDSDKIIKDELGLKNFDRDINSVNNRTELIKGDVQKGAIINDNKISDDEHELENNLQDTNGINKNTERLLNIEKDVIQIVNSSANDVLLNEIEQNIHNVNSNEKCEKLGELEKKSLQNANGFGCLKTVTPTDNSKTITNSNHEIIAPKPKIVNSFKAHIHCENEIPDESKHGGKQSLERNTLPDADTICGLGFFKPRWLQPYATAKIYVILYSIIGILHGSYYSYLIGTLSTLEKRFAFKSKVSGTIMVADEITPLLLGMIIGYYASKAHRPRIVAFGMLLSAGCCFCSSLPYFIYGSIQDLLHQNIRNNVGPEYCELSTGTESCDTDRPQNLLAVLLLIFGSFLKGFGNLAYYAIGLAYLDDNSDKKSTPIYLAIALALRLLGPLVGFLMSSGFLKLYENPVYDPGFGPDDPRWIGAWWIGFVLQGVLLVIFTIPIALFPRRLPGQRKIDTVAVTAVEDGLKEMFHGLISALKRLLKNPVFIVLIINTVMKIFGHFGHAIMLPKYMENQFRLSASEASLYSGATTITCIMISTVLGGFLIWKFRPRIKVLLAGMIVSEIVLCIGFLLLMIPRCQPSDMSHFGMDEEGLVLNSVCNKNCDCTTTSFTPFCGPDGKTTYFSPCYAGCTVEMASSTSIKNKVFGNCSCVDQQQTGTTISEGFCPDENCKSQMLIYLIILFVLVTMSNLFTVAHTMILLRSVHPNDKSVALGTFETFICLFGFIPFPVTFGALVDSACLVWEKNCGETGNCWFYDMEKYGYLLHGTAALFCSFSVVCLITLYFFSSRMRDLYVEEADEDEKKYVDIKLDTVSNSVTKL